MPSGRTMKWREASSGWPAPNSSSASEGSSQFLPVPLVPCSSSDGVVDLARGVAVRRAEHSVVQPEFGQRLAAFEDVVLQHEIAFALVRPGALRRSPTSNGQRDGEAAENKRGVNEHDQGSPLG